MTQGDPRPAAERILSEVVRLLEAGGPDAIVLSEVARCARVSLRDVYKHFGSRDELVVAAVAQWMESHVYRPLAAPAADAPLFETLLAQFRFIFEPWEHNPRMLESFVYARSTRTGEQLLRQGEAAAGLASISVFDHIDPVFAEDFALIMTNVVHGLLARFAAGQLPITELMPTIERVLRRLAVDVAHESSPRASSEP